MARMALQEHPMAKVPKVLKTLYDDPDLQNNCSGFFKAVVQKLGIPMPDLTADKLIDTITDPSSQWVEIAKPKPDGTGPVDPTVSQKGGPDAAKAADYAGQGYLVVALLKAKEHYPFRFNKVTKKYDISHPYSHGHMAIVLAGALDAYGYPYLVSGSIVDDGKSDGSKSVRGVWRGIDAPNVHYYYWPTKFPDLLKTD
jgi:hypothetical protein